MKDWLAIVNPAAGRPGEARACADRLHAQGMSVRAEYTRAPGHAAELARSAGAAAGIIAVGGDGTVQEVLEGLDRERQVLALLPAGHGNCLARDLGLGSLEGALAALRAPRPRTIDLVQVRWCDGAGVWRERLAASTLALGYVAEVVRRGRLRLPWLGRAAYAAASALTRPRRLTLELSVDGFAPERRRCTGLVINNTAHLANYRAFPEAQLDDGRLDVMEIDACWVRQMAHNAALLAGSRRFGALRSFQAERLELRLERPATLMLDGELLPGVREMAARSLLRSCRCLGGGLERPA